MARIENKAKKTTATTYVNVNRASKGYRDKYKKLVEDTLKKFKASMGKPDDYELTDAEWRTFFTTFLIPLDKDSERRMIDLFKTDRPELNKLLVLHNTKASDNLAEVYFKKYQKNSPTKWHDLEDFRQMALEGLAIAADRFDLDRGDRFLTYATWWVLNKVRHPFSVQLANKCHTSLDAPLSPNDPDNTTTLEDVLGSDECANGWTSSSSTESVVNPAARIEKRNFDENIDLYNTLKNMRKSCLGEADPNSARRMADYLVSIVENKNNTYDNRQIYLYIFKKVFGHCSTILGDDQKLANYTKEAAQSKSELLERIHMDEKQYEAVCQKLTRGVYDGI